MSQDMRRLMETVTTNDETLNENFIDDAVSLVFSAGLAVYLIPAFIKMFQAYYAEKKGQHARTEELLNDLATHFAIPVKVAAKLVQIIQKRVNDKLDRDGSLFEGIADDLRKMGVAPLLIKVLARVAMALTDPVQVARFWAFCKANRRPDDGQDWISYLRDTYGLNNRTIRAMATAFAPMDGGIEEWKEVLEHLDAEEAVNKSQKRKTGRDEPEGETLEERHQHGASHEPSDHHLKWLGHLSREHGQKGSEATQARVGQGLNGFRNQGSLPRSERMKLGKEADHNHHVELAADLLRGDTIHEGLREKIKGMLQKGLSNRQIKAKLKDEPGVSTDILHRTLGELRTQLKS